MPLPLHWFVAGLALRDSAAGLAAAGVRGDKTAVPDGSGAIPMHPIGLDERFVGAYTTCATTEH
jgi:hypothetical protein